MRDYSAVILYVKDSSLKAAAEVGLGGGELSLNVNHRLHPLIMLYFCIIIQMNTTCLRVNLIFYTNNSVQFQLQLLLKTINLSRNIFLYPIQDSRVQIRCRKNQIKLAKHLQEILEDIFFYLKYLQFGFLPTDSTTL